MKIAGAAYNLDRILGNVTVHLLARVRLLGRTWHVQDLFNWIVFVIVLPVSINAMKHHEDRTT